jgi:uncharacterized protein
MGDWGLYLLFLVPPLVVGLAVQAWLRRTFSKYSHLQLASGLSGAQVARQILDRNGLDEVPVTHSPGVRSRTTTTRASARSTSPNPSSCRPR